MFFYVNVPQKDREKAGSSVYRMNSENILYYREWANDDSEESNQTVFFLKSGKQIVSDNKTSQIDSILEVK